MLSLSSLAGWEDAVAAAIEATTGTPEERYRQIERSGMYGEYPAILGGYVELFGAEDCALEALKRALFLVWRGAMFSPDETGIAALPDAISRMVMEELDAAIRQDRTDDELRWMLAWYRDTGEVALELMGATPRALRWEGDLGRDAWRDARIAPATMARRGQLGHYWSTLRRPDP
jgi:hypothetical protein